MNLIQTTQFYILCIYFNFIRISSLSLNLTFFQSKIMLIVWKEKEYDPIRLHLDKLNYD